MKELIDQKKSLESIDSFSEDLFGNMNQIINKSISSFTENTEKNIMKEKEIWEYKYNEELLNKNMLNPEACEVSLINIKFECTVLPQKDQLHKVLEEEDEKVIEGIPLSLNKSLNNLSHEEKIEDTLINSEKDKSDVKILLQNMKKSEKKLSVLDENIPKILEEPKAEDEGKLPTEEEVKNSQQEKSPLLKDDKSKNSVSKNEIDKNQMKTELQTQMKHQLVEDPNCISLKKKFSKNRFDLDNESIQFIYSKVL